MNEDQEKEKPSLPKKDEDLPKTSQKGGIRGGKTNINKPEETDS
jgi:hypothetical protein